MNNNLDLLSFKCKLIPLTPIHIGSGNEIEPYDYVIKNGVFYRINSMDIFENLNDKEKELFTSKIEEGLISFRTYIRDIYKEDFGYIYKSDVDKNFENKYNQKLNGAKSRNENSEFVIKEFMGGLRGKYIAGSSLKGSIRGAYIYDKLPNSINYKLERNTRIKTMPPVLYDTYSKPVTSKKIKNIMDEEFNKQAFEMTSLSPFIDPFKRLTITDTAEYSDVSKIVECKRVSINKETKEFKKGSSDYLEVLKSKYADDVENSLEFNISIRYLGKEGISLMKNYYDGSKNNRREFGEILTFDQMDLIESINSKMKEVLEEEIKFYNRTTNNEIKDLYEELKREFDSLEENEAIIRLGTGSGFATFTHLLKSTNKNIRSSSRVLAEEKYPMGWAKIVIE